MEQYVELYTGVLKKWNVFSGRARRREYWMFALMNFIIFVILGVVGGILGQIWGPLATLISVVSALLSLVLIIPNFAVGIRRLHDTNRSGWLFLLALIPLIGVIILLVFFIQEGTSGGNKYGSDPKA